MNEPIKPWESPDFDDSPDWTEADFVRAKPTSAFPKLARAPLVKRGRPAMSPDDRKQSVSIRLSPDVLATLRASGDGWHARVDMILRKGLGL